MAYATFHAPETSFGPYFNAFWHGSRPVVIEPSYDFYDVHVHDCSVWANLKLEKIEKSSLLRLFLSFFIFTEFQAFTICSPYQGKLITGLRISQGGGIALLC